MNDFLWCLSLMIIRSSHSIFSKDLSLSPSMRGQFKLIWLPVDSIVLHLDPSLQARSPRVLARKGLPVPVRPLIMMEAPALRYSPVTGWLTAPDSIPLTSLVSSSSMHAWCLKLAFLISLSILLLRRLSSSLWSSSSRLSENDSLSVWRVTFCIL